MWSLKPESRSYILNTGIVSDGQFSYWIAKYQTICGEYELISSLYLVLVERSKHILSDLLFGKANI